MTFSQFSELYGSELAAMLEPLMDQLAASPNWELGNGTLEEISGGCSKEFSAEVAKLRQWVVGSVERHHKGAFGFHVDKLLPEAFAELADEAMLIVDPSRAKKAVFLRDIAAASKVELPRSHKREDVLAFLDKAKEALRSKPTAAEKVVRGEKESVQDFVKRKAQAETGAAGSAEVGEVFGMISWVTKAYENRRGGNAPAKPEDPRKKLEEEISEIRQRIANLQDEEKDFAARGDYANAAARKTERGRLEATRLSDLQKQLTDFDAAKAEKTRLGAAAAIVVSAPKRPGEAEPMGAPVPVDAAKLAAKTEGPTADELRAEVKRLNKEAADHEAAVHEKEAEAVKKSRIARFEGTPDEEAETLLREARMLRQSAAASSKAAERIHEKLAELDQMLEKATAAEEKAAKAAETKPVKKAKKDSKIEVTKVAKDEGPPKQTGDVKADLAAQIAHYAAKNDTETVANLAATLKAIGG